jgi:hypothetical protein
LHLATARSSAWKTTKHREIYLHTGLGTWSFLCPRVAAQSRVYHVRAGNDVHVVDYESDPSGSSRLAALDPDSEPISAA